MDQKMQGSLTCPLVVPRSSKAPQCPNPPSADIQIHCTGSDLDTDSASESGRMAREFLDCLVPVPPTPMGAWY